MISCRSLLFLVGDTKKSLADKKGGYRLVLEKRVLTRPYFVPAARNSFHKPLGVSRAISYGPFSGSFLLSALRLSFHGADRDSFFPWEPLTRHAGHGGIKSRLSARYCGPSREKD